MTLRRPMFLHFSLIFLLFFSTEGFAADPYNLWVSGLYTDRKDVAPGDMINVTYLLQANAALFGRLDMGIFVRSGPNGIWAAEWSIPPSEGSAMGAGNSLIKTVQVPIPDWGDGTYFISVNANKSGFLAESNYEDNSMEVPINVKRIRKVRAGLDDLLMGEPTFRRINQPPFTHEITVTFDNPSPYLTEFKAWCEYQCPGGTITKAGFDIVQGGYIQGKSKFTYTSFFRFQCSPVPSELQLLCPIEYNDGSRRAPYAIHFKP